MSRFLHCELGVTSHAANIHKSERDEQRQTFYTNIEYYVLLMYVDCSTKLCTTLIWRDAMRGARWGLEYPEL